MALFLTRLSIIEAQAPTSEADKEQRPIEYRPNSTRRLRAILQNRTVPRLTVAQDHEVPLS